MDHIILTPINLDKPSTINGKKAKNDYLREISNSPSFKDHDISIVKNNTTGEIYYIDPSLSEVFGNIIVKR